MDRSSVRTDVVYSRNLGRKIRMDPVSRLGISTWDLAKQAIRRGNMKQALAYVDYLNLEGKRLHDLYTEWVFALVNYIAKRSEDEVYKAYRYSLSMSSATGNPWGTPRTPASTESLVQLVTEAFRNHRSGPKEKGNFKMKEDKEKISMILDPCGSGGRMMRVGEVDGLPPRTEAPFFFGKTRKPYPWSWGKKGVPYYCAHCCVLEILDVERFGFPRRVVQFPKKPDHPCTWLFYKDPNAIPDIYFTRIGKEKDPSKFVTIPPASSSRVKKQKS